MSRIARSGIGLFAVTVLVLAGSGVAPGDRASGQSGGEVPAYRSPQDICLSPDGAKAYVVNQTSDSVSVVDVAARKVVDEFPVGRHPATAAVSPDGGTLYVTSCWGQALEFVDLEKKEVFRRIETGYEPYGVRVSKDGRRLYVANAQSNTVSFVDAASGEILRQIEVGRDPRYVAETPDGKRLVVGNGLSRNVTIIDVAEGKVAETRELERASLLRTVACSPDGRWAFVAMVVSHDEQMTLQMERGWIHSNGFTVVDLREPGRDTTLLLDKLLAGAANPWGVAVSRNGRRLYVSLAGVHEVAFVDLRKALGIVRAVRGPEDMTALRRDVELLEREKLGRRRKTRGRGPRGIALHEERGELLVANYFTDNISVMDARTGKVLDMIELGPPQEMTLWRRGELLFNDAEICFQKWFSCASCHQEDGTMDALNWDLANDGLGNPKNAKSLHDVYDTPPAMWGGVRKDIDAAVQAGQRFLGFIRKPKGHQALMAYLGNPPRAPNPYRTRNPEALRRGEEIFRRAQCHVCHPAPTYTDLKMHDLDMRSPTDLRSRFDTPSLRECYRTAPYLHDGRAETLRSLFTEHNPRDRHGRTSNLTEEELEDLLEYLRSF